MLESLFIQTKIVALYCSGGGQFLGFPAWYKYVCGGKTGEQEFQFLGSPGGGPGDIALVALALLEILLRIAGLVAIAYVVYGSVRYVISQGEDKKIADAKGTILNALIGLVISTLAVSLVAFIGNRLG